MIDDTEIAALAQRTPSQELRDAWLQFHAFIILGGFKLENLAADYQYPFRRSQLRLIEAIRAAAVREANIGV